MESKVDQDPNRENVPCPYCRSSESAFWVHENGFDAVKCTDCGLVYVNPRPLPHLIVDAVETGVHVEVEHNRTAVVRRVPSKVKHYELVMGKLLQDVWDKGKPISWLDVGAGYGEFVEAIGNLAPMGSKVVGLEPMNPKREAAIARGLEMQSGFLHELEETYEYVSLVNVFSHIAEFHEFMNDLIKVVPVGGEFFLETGNIGDMVAKDVPSELDLPDHLVFAGEKNIRGFLVDHGFEVIHIESLQVDTWLNFAKNIIKNIFGRRVPLAMPFTSDYRTLLVRSRRIK